MQSSLRGWLAVAATALLMSVAAPACLPGDVRVTPAPQPASATATAPAVPTTTPTLTTDAVTLAATATPVPPTAVVEYEPSSPGGTAMEGTCWTNSLLLPARTAWRCQAGSTILDPCFSLENGEMVCVPNPLAGDRGLLLKLAEPLPSPDVLAERPDAAWLVRLRDGSVCTFVGGATAVVDGRRINYYCGRAGGPTGPRVAIIGDFVTGAVWWAEVATITQRDGRLMASDSARVPLQAVVRPPAALVAYGCGTLADRLGAVLGLVLARSERRFVDPFTGARGLACQMELPSEGAVRDRLDRALRAQGWEVAAGSAVSNSAGVSGYRQGDALCVVQTTSGGSAATTLACSRDRTATRATPTAVQPPQQVMFRPMATWEMLAAPIGAAAVHEYALTAFAGQTIVLELTSSSPDVFLSVTTAAGKMLASPAQNLRRWHGRLPASEEYVVRVAARAGAADYTLRVIIPDEIAPAAGATVVSTRSIGADGLVPYHYVVASPADRQLTLNLKTAVSGATLAVSRLSDGRVLLPASSRLARWTAPAGAENYLVEVVAEAAPFQFTLEATAQ